MKKLNQMTQAEADSLYEKLRKSVKPSKQFIKYVDDVLFKKAHYIFQYKEKNVRMCYCTRCKKDFVIEPSKLRLVKPEHYLLLETKHNGFAKCPCCGADVIKRYAAYSQKAAYADAVEFKVDKSGALIIYCYAFKYRYDYNIRNNIEWTCYNIGYFDINKWFYVLNGWGGSRAYIGNKYISRFSFTTDSVLIEPFRDDQDINEGTHIFNVDEYKKSNLKYSCISEYINFDRHLFKYLTHYCSYPLITEKVVKEFGIEGVTDYLNGFASGLLNFRAKTVPEYFKLSKEEYNCWAQTEQSSINLYSSLNAMQFFKRNGLKFDNDFYLFLCNYSLGIDRKISLIEKLLKYKSFGKVKKWMREQGKLLGFQESCNPMYRIEPKKVSNVELYSACIRTFADYVALAAKLRIDIESPKLIMPNNLYLAHREQNEIIQQREEEKRRKELESKAANEEDFKKKHLPKLQKKYCYSDGCLFIRPAESYEDLSKEAAAQTNCVYRLYSDKYIINRKTDILFIRRCDEPDTSYYTVEFNKGVIVQCRTEFNRGQNEEVKAFCEKWLAFLKQNKNQKKREVA